MVSVEFMPLAVNPENYPRPVLSMLPGRMRVTWPGNEQGASPFLAGDFFVFGRYALVEALRRAGVRAGDAVLLPAYHCRTVVESALYLGAEVRLYPMTASLRPDFARLEPLCADGKAKAFVLTHYFGFPNDLARVRTLCDQTNMALVEDCAHALYGQDDQGHVLGSIGDYAVTSVWKFFPLRDGALLRDNSPGAGAPSRLRAPSLWSEIKALADVARSLGRSRGPGSPLPRPVFDALVAQVLELGARPEPALATDEIQFRRDQVIRQGLRVSRALVRLAPHAEIRERRRALYRHWLRRIEGVPGVRPLFARLPDGVVPYAFPLLTDPRGWVFHALRLAGVPIWRWEDVARTSCAVSQNYRLRLLQLPCHQDLTEGQIDWVVHILEGVMSRLPVPEHEFGRASDQE